MSRISQPVLVRAITAIDAMDSQRQEELAEEIFNEQPNLLSSVLALGKLGVDADRMAFAVRMLLVCFQSMKESGLKWPTISQEDLSGHLTRWLSSVQMRGELGPTLSDYSTLLYIDAHPEKDLLAYVTTGLVDLLKKPTSPESDRYVMMAVLNLVNCITYANPPMDADATR